ERILRPIVFYNEISFQLKNFCKAVYNEFNSWDFFANELNGKSIFAIFEKLRKHKGIRLSFKNLAAMKIFVGMDDDLLVLDRHVAKNSLIETKFHCKKQLVLEFSQYLY
ncbi:hypothetical protein KEJ15_06730, partial [Candidatus Bathyarchaeota archaeon]|nr:hypothetical protein [Candidatus Bathyarchaeota archaeon]